ncbi:PRA1 family protein [Psidium guajava]|nr:PRA1 family protein [Psidium guajava]
MCAGVTHRPSSIFPSIPPMETPDEPKVKSPDKLNLGFPFNLPATPEAAAVRIIKNLCHFSLFYVLVLWVGLSISLVPQRKPSLLLLMATSIIGNQYLMMLQLMPKAICVRKAFDKTLVLVLMAIVTIVELFLTEAGIHLVITLGIGIPIILVHAVLWRDDLFASEEAPASVPGESAPLVDNV